MTKATNDGVSMSISYDAKGNTTGTTLTGTNTSDKITSSAAYDSTGNYVTSQTDARGNTVTYTYGNNISKMTGQPTAVTDPTNVTRTSSYNTANGRITGTEITGTASLDYIYGSGRLTTMTRGGYVPGDTTEQTQSYTMSYDGFGNMTGVSVGNKSLATYTYSGNNGQLQQMTYGNGDSVSYSYDNLERVQNVYYNGSTSPALTYSYKGEGTLGSLTDSVNNRTYSYTYDSLGRLGAMTEKSGSTSVQTYNASYDTANRLTGYNYQLSPAWDGTLGSTRTYGYTYKASDGSLSSMTAPGGSYAYNYDGLKRLSSRVLTVGGTTLINRQFGYLAGAGTNGTTLLVSSLTNKDSSGSTISQYNYTYDALGNITAISGSTSASYTYDNQSQLLTETVGDTTYTYTYDTYGNLRSKTDGTNTDTYTYGDSQWLDLLTAYNGNTISYDAIGNPTTWYDGTTFTWVNGRRLASATNTSEGLTASYTYDSDGLRLTKSINGVEHKYLWQGSKLVSEYYDGKELEFFYDESGNPYAFSYKASSTATPVTYYYLTNLQGDITGILDSSGTSVASYTYNAWGEILSSTGDLADVNPLRYRGYYYDAETSLYYLQSRYYDPEICRFINADDAISTGQGILGANAFAYCLNNPVNMTDSSGSLPEWMGKAAGIALGVAAGLLAAAVVASMAPAVFCAATIGMTYLGMSYSAATTIATVGIYIVGANATVYAADAAYTAATGESPMLSGFNGNETAYNTWQFASAMSLYGYGAMYNAGSQIGVCFVAGTLVAAKDGYIPIENIEEGDLVWAWDENTNAVTLKPVVETYINETTELVHVTVHGNEIVSTPNHPFYSPVKGWTVATHLRAGDILVLVNGEYVVVEKVQHELLENPVKVFNFQVADYHTYFVGNSGVLVHNACSQPNSTTPWNIKSSKKQVQYYYNGTKTTAYFDGKYYWAIDYAGHGNSAYKVFEERGGFLRWIADADLYGNFITGKHKGDVGIVVKIIGGK